MSQSDPPDPTPTRIGDYEIEGLLGSGGMAKVYKAKHAILETVHAVKVLDPEYRANPEARKRFLDEAKIQAKHLDHLNIVKVTNIVATSEHAALVMELIDGPSLESHMPELKGEPGEIKRIMQGVLDGVGYAHKAGIIHRDLKPANVLLAKRGDQLIPKVSDFGIAKLTVPDDGKGGKKSTHAAARMGTLSYMSPEQIRRAKDVTARSDVFSLGAMLYELATGSMAFGGDSDYDVMENIVNGRYQLPERKFEKIDPLLARVIQKALETDPADRFASCEEMAAALRGEIAVVKKSKAAPPEAEKAKDGPVPTQPDSRTVASAERDASGGGSGKSLALVMVVGALVLGGGAIFFATRKGTPATASAGTGGSAGSDSAVAMITPDAIEIAPPDAAAIVVAPTDAAVAIVPKPVDAGVADAPRAKHLDAGTIAVRPKAIDAGVVQTPQNACAGHWTSKELTIDITGTATTCGGTYTLTDVGGYSRGTCSGSLGGCRTSSAATTAAFTCKYTEHGKYTDNDTRPDHEAGTFTLTCGGGTTSVATIEGVGSSDSKNVLLKR